MDKELNTIQEASFDYVPDDILMEIFQLLQIKELLVGKKTIK
jgi:hypothetical protein